MPQKHFSFYHASLADLPVLSNSTDVFQAGSLADVATAWKHGQKSLLSLESTLFCNAVTPQAGLCDNWVVKWDILAAAAASAIAQGSLLGFNLGDELVLKCIPPATIAKAAERIRTNFPRGKAILWYNEAAHPWTPFMDFCGQPHNFSIPGALDWFSIDMYHMDGPEAGWVGAQVKAFYERWIFPGLGPQQRAVLVPGSFGSDVNHFPNGTYVS